MVYRSLIYCLLLYSTWFGNVSLVLADEKSNVEFFEKKIRPVLVESCYSCHSGQAKSVKGGLRLDSRKGIRRGGESGPAIVPGKVEASLLISAIQHDDLEMPPGKKLSKQVVTDFIRWIELGATDPRDKPDVAKAETSLIDAKDHWAFQPVLNPIPPKVNSSRAQTVVDQFVVKRLHDAGLDLAPKATRTTLIRRAYFDLLGLPPTPEQVREFLEDKSPDAFHKLVDRLLESPHYGERWGRIWLDVARYADNKGYVFFEDKNFPWAWTYRDYVVRSFNEDLPFDQFVVQQLAADRLPLGDDKRALAAMGYLTLGARFMNSTHDIVDDRIDVVTRGLMGLTVTCARCHDHKYDPILQSDYYGLYGVFRSSMEPVVPPEFMPSPNSEPYAKFKSGLNERIGKLDKFMAEQRAMITKASRARAVEYLMAVHAKRNHPITENFMLLTDKGALNPAMIHRWEVHVKHAKRKVNSVWTAWHAFAKLDDEQFSAKAKAVHATLFAKESKVPTNKFIRDQLEAQVPASMQQVADGYGRAFKKVEKMWQDLLAQPIGGPLPTRLVDDDAEAVRQVLYGAGSPPMIPKQLSWGFLDLLPDRPTQGEYKKLLGELEKWSKSQPGAPPRAMTLEDTELPFDPVIFIRGNPSRHGDLVARQFPQFLSHPKSEPYESGSGRLEMARQIVARDNPLTARVFVNRVWMNHFGQGLVKTPSDFGLRSEQPSHPQLLDWLATEFMKSWSVKDLHRTMMNTSVYQQASDLKSTKITRSAAKVDPQNRLLWKFNRRRLEFESMRDALVAVTGNMDTRIGGKSTNILSGFNARRTIYGFINRMDLPNLLRAFDFPDPASSSPKREQTTIAPQALFFLNDGFIADVASRISRRGDLGSISTDDKIKRLYLVLFGRDATDEELAVGRQYLAPSTPTEEETSAWSYGYGKVDEKTKRTVSFTPLTYWTGQRWQVGPRLPDPQKGWVFIDRRGGHPAATLERCVIRRWTSPSSGTLKITSQINHLVKEGNGIRGRVVSSRHGVLSTYTIFNVKSKQEARTVEVEAGDTIDFVADFNSHITHDEHEWMIQLELSSKAANQPTKTWDSVADFKGGTLDMWASYVQALLMTNEFLFID